ncbi:hypothetical protein D9M69_600540 [compost metagenome]
MQRVPQCQDDRAAGQHDPFSLGRQCAEEDPGIKVPDRIRIGGAVERDVTDPERAESECVCQPGQRQLLAEVRHRLPGLEHG